MNDTTMPSDEELHLLEGFEHEFDVTTERLKIIKPIFDGRLGDPALMLKKKLARFVKFHFSKALHEVEVRARIDELKSIQTDWDKIRKSYVGFAKYANDRIATLTAEKEKKV